MSRLTRHEPTPLRLPFGQQVYTHPMPDTQTCRSFWSQPMCTCGQYLLTWESKAVAWSNRSALPLDLIPDNQGIIAILADAIDGSYRFAHDALKPWVTVSPANRNGSITVRATPRLSLQGRAKTRRLQSAATMTLAVILDAPEERLVEVRSVGTRPKAMKPPPDSIIEIPSVRIVGTVPVAKPSPSRPVRPPMKAPTRLIVAPETPPDVDAPVPEILAAIRQKADVHPELRDYVVIPESSVPTMARLPGWVVRSPLVDHIRIVKPRLDSDEPFGGAST